MRHFQESFDALTPAQLAQTGKWSLVGNGVVSTTGRTENGVTGTTGATQGDNTLRTRAFYPAFASAGAYQGIAVKVTSLPAAERKLWAVLDNTGAVQMTLTIRTDGKVRLYRGTFEGGTLLATSATAFLVASAFRYLQIGFNFGTNIAIILSTISGVTPVTSQLFAVPGLSSYQPWAQFEFYLDDSIIVDDYYLNDDIGPSAGHIFFDGDTTIEVHRPAQVAFAIAYFPWTPNSGSDRVAVVDDEIMDNDSTYLFTRQDFSTIHYDFDEVPDDGRRIDAVQITAIGRRTSSDFAIAIKMLFWRWDGIVVPMNTYGITSTAYLAYLSLVQSGGSNEWTIQRLNDSRFGLGS